MTIEKGLLKGSLILLVAFNIYNFLNFMFHFAMIRMMSVVEYGILASLFSIIYIFSFFTEAIQTVITKYTAKENEKGKLKNIFKKSLGKAFSVSFVLLGLYLIIAFPLTYFLKVEYGLLALNGLMIIMAFLLPVSRGILQGRKRFKGLGINMITESGSKLVLALLFVFVGWSVFGAILGTILGAGASFLLSFVNLKDIIKSKEEKAETKGIYSFTGPTFLVVFIVLFIYSVDVIFARALFPGEIAGAYAIASILAKTIFFGTQPISRAMFPISARHNKDEKKSESVFLNAFVILLLAIGAALAVFYFFSEWIIRIFSGEFISSSAGILFPLGIAVGFLCLANLVLLYKLSVGKVPYKSYLILLIFIPIEGVLLWIFSGSLMQFSIAFIAAAALFFWGSVFLLREK